MENGALAQARAAMTVRRLRQRKARPGQLIAYWGRLPGDGPDLIYAYGGSGANKRCGNLLHHILGERRVEVVEAEESAKTGRSWKLGKTPLELLDEAGFDITTLRFSIQMKSLPSAPDANPSAAFVGPIPKE
jgi:hypothetical protein